MSKIKRSISALLALIMVFSVMTAAFTVSSSAVQIVSRTAKDNPSATFTVPQFLESHGSNAFERGTNLNKSGTVFLQVKGASEVSLSCSEAGVAFSDYTMGTDSYTWQVNGGKLNSSPVAGSSVKWTVSYKVGGKTYITEAWSSIKIAHANPGYATNLSEKGAAMNHETKNAHAEWIEPVYGNYGDKTGTGYNCNIDMESGTYILTSANTAAGYYWKKSSSGQNPKAPLTVTGNYYIDVSKYSNLSQTPLMVKMTPTTEMDTDSNHFQMYKGSSVVSATVNGSTSTAFSTTNNSSTNKIKFGTYATDTFAGTIPAKNSTIAMTVNVRVEGNVDGWFGSSYHLTTDNKYDLTMYTYDKTALNTLLARVTAANYQQKQFLNKKPTDGGTYTNFRTWDQYHEALQNAWVIYGREDVTQTMIDAAVTTLNACLPVYSGTTWISGIMFAPADYNAIDVLLDSIPTDYYEAYSDGTNGKYYRYSYAEALELAISDVNYDRPLDSRYQAAVDTMKQNLAVAVTSMEGQYKDVKVSFDANCTDATQMPAQQTVMLYGRAQQPTEPKRKNYSFNGWYFDEACTQKVPAWPFGINPSHPYFKANLNTKTDVADVAFTLYAGWTLTGKTLTFVLNGGSAPGLSAVTGENGERYSGPALTPLKDGYNFDGWYMDAALTNPVDWTTFTFGMTDKVYAKWARASFTVTFDANGGLFANNKSTFDYTALYESAIPAPETPKRSSSAFDGWYYDTTFTSQVDFANFKMPSSAIRVYAKWDNSSRNLIIEKNNGEAPTVLSYKVGDTISKPLAPSRDGYDFVNWYTNASLTQLASFPITVSSSNVTLYARWAPKLYSVTFNPGEGTMPASFKASDYQGLECGSVLVEPEEPYRQGYVFKGWARDGELYTFTTVPATDLSLTAVWETEPYTTRFRVRTDRTGALTQGDVINTTVSISSNHIVSTVGFVLYYDARYLQPALNGKPYTDAPSAALTWSRTPGQKYFTVLNNKGGNVTDCGNISGRVNNNGGALNQFYPADWLASRSELKPEYEHYEFLYFASADNGGTATRVQPDPEQDLVTFQFIVRDNAPILDGVEEFAQILMPTNFSRTPDFATGKVQACRETQAAYDPADYWDTTYVFLNNDIRFSIEEMTTSRISFVTNSASSLNAMDAKQGRIIELPTPTKAYHDFLGWTLTNDENDTDYVDLKNYIVPKHDITLYAKWAGQATTYYVRHHKQDLTATGFLANYEEQRLTAGIGTYVTAVPKNYPGFNCTTSAAGTVDAINPLILDLYYVRNTTVVTLNANGGQFSNKQASVELSGLYESAVNNVYGEPERVGYTFNGWTYGNSAYELSTYPAADITLNAAWTANSYSLRFYLNGALFNTITAPYGSSITPPTVNVGSGMAFSGWKNNNNEPFAYTTMPAGDENFYGTTGIDGYYLTLMVNGTQYGQKIAVASGNQVTEDMVAYKPATGYSFGGWRKTNSRTGARATFPMTLTSDTTLYGFTTRETYTVTLYYVFDGVPELFETVSGFYGDTFVLPEPEEWEGYGFNGWYLDPELTRQYNKPSKMAAANIEIYGEYYELQGTLHFDANGALGRAPEDMTGAIGDVLTLPGSNTLIKQYYKFGGWAKSSTSTVPIKTFEIKEPVITTFYAIWTANFATVMFNTNGADAGSAPESQKVEVGKSLATLPAGTGLTKDGFMFIGWAETADAKEPITSFTATATGNKTLYAVWAPLSVELVTGEDTDTVIDNENGFIYGLTVQPTEEDIKDLYLGVEGNGHIELEYNGFVGTGTIVKLVNDFTGNVDATYTLVIFGDVNGDGAVNAVDISMIKGINSGAVTLTAGTATALSADLNGDGLVNGTDIVIAKAMFSGSATLNQSDRTLS